MYLKKVLFDHMIDVLNCQSAILSHKFRLIIRQHFFSTCKYISDQFAVTKQRSSRLIRKTQIVCSSSLIWSKKNIQKNDEQKTQTKNITTEKTEFKTLSLVRVKKPHYKSKIDAFTPVLKSMINWSVCSTPLRTLKRSFHLWSKFCCVKLPILERLLTLKGWKWNGPTAIKERPI